MRIESLDRIAPCSIIEVSPSSIVSQIGVICIGIRSVASTIDIAMDGGEDSNGIAAIDRTRDIIAAIDIVDVTFQYSHTC